MGGFMPSGTNNPPADTIIKVLFLIQERPNLRRKREIQSYDLSASDDGYPSNALCALNK